MDELIDKIERANSVWLFVGEDCPIDQADCERLTTDEKSAVLAALRALWRAARTQ